MAELSNHQPSMRSPSVRAMSVTIATTFVPKSSRRPSLKPIGTIHASSGSGWFRW